MHKQNKLIWVLLFVLLGMTLACSNTPILEQLTSPIATLEAYSKELEEIISPVTNLSIKPSDKAGQAIIQWEHPKGEDLIYDIYVLGEPITDENWQQVNKLDVGNRDITYSTENNTIRMFYVWENIPLHRKFYIVVRQSLSGLEELEETLEILEPILGIEIPQETWTIPPSVISPSNMVSIIDTGFRPNPDGYSFKNNGPRNFDPPVSKDDYIEILRRIYGDDVVCKRVDDDGDCRPRRSAKKYARKAIKRGQCFGFTTTAGFFFLGKAELRDFPGEGPFPPGTTYNIPSKKEILEFIMIYQKYQNNPDVANQMDEIGALTLRENLNALEEVMKNPTYLPNMGIIDDTTDILNLGLIDDSKKCPGHSVLPYFLSTDNVILTKIWVYDNNTPDDISRFIDVNTQEDYWSYQFSPSDNWSGSNNNQEKPCGYMFHSNIHNFGTDEDVGAFGKAPWLESFFTVMSDSLEDLFIISSSGDSLGIDSDGNLINEISGSRVTIVDEYGSTNIILPSDTYQYIVNQVNSEDPEFMVFGNNRTYSFESLTIGDQFLISPENINYTNDTRSGNSKISLILESDIQSNLVGYQADIALGDQINIAYDSNSVTVRNNSSESLIYNLDVELITDEIHYQFSNDNNTQEAQDSIVVDLEEIQNDETFILGIDNDSDGTVNETVPLENEYEPEEEDSHQQQRETSRWLGILIIASAFFVLLIIIIVIIKKQKKTTVDEYSDDDFFNF